MIVTSHQNLDQYTEQSQFVSLLLASCRAREEGVLLRPGHTEAAVDMAKLAGCHPAGETLIILLILGCLFLWRYCHLVWAL